MEELEERYIVQVDNFYLSEFLFCWVYYEQPCPMMMLKPNTKGFTAIKLIVKDAASANFLIKAKEKTGCILHKFDQ